MRSRPYNGYKAQHMGTYMKTHFLYCLLAIFSLVGCSESDSTTDSQNTDYERQVKVYDEQMKKHQEQQAEYEKQVKAYNEQTNQYEEQQAESKKQIEISKGHQKRMEILLERWEKQADRYDEILDKWEKE